MFGFTVKLRSFLAPLGHATQPFGHATRRRADIIDTLSCDVD